METIINYLQELSKISLINSLVVLFSVYFGFYLNERTQSKKEKKEAEQIFNFLHDEIKSNLDNNLNKKFSSEYLSVLGEEVLKAKIVILAAYYKDSLNNFIKIYIQLNNINKTLSNFLVLEQARNPSKKIKAHKELIQMRSSSKKDIKHILKKAPG